MGCTSLVMLCASTVILTERSYARELGPHMQAAAPVDPDYGSDRLVGQGRGLRAAQVRVVVGKDVVATVEPEMLSYTIDSAIFCEGEALQRYLGNTAVRARVRALAPMVLRLGGTSEDMSQFAGGAQLPTLPGVPARCNQSAAGLAAVSSFANATGVKVIFGLNSLVRKGAEQTGAWDSSNAAALMRVDATRNQSGLPHMFAFELGNEPHLWQVAGYGRNISAAAHAADWKQLRALVASEYGGISPSPRLVGPDVWVPCLVHGEPGGPAIPGSPPVCDVSYLSKFFTAQPDLDVMTFHLYPAIGSYGPWYTPTAKDLYSLDFLNIASTAAQQVTTAVRVAKPRVPIWMGEGSPDWRIGDTSHDYELARNLTFELFSTDMAASLARHGVRAYLRQCLTSAIGNSGGVTAAFWSALLWKQLMAEDVFAANSSSPDLRVYAHATRPMIAAVGVTVLLINRSPQPLSVDIDVEVAPTDSGLGGARCSGSQQEWHVTAGPHVTVKGARVPGILVNGIQPAFPEGSNEPPVLEPRRTPCGAAVTVAARSWNFVVRAR